MQPTDEAYLRDVLDAARVVRYLVEDFDLERFREDIRTNSAVIRQLEIMGEATKHLSLELRQHHRDVPWRRIAGMRDVLIHGYRTVALVEVWKAATEAVPALIEQFERILAAGNSECNDTHRDDA